MTTRVIACARMNLHGGRLLLLIRLQIYERETLGQLSFRHLRRGESVHSILLDRRIDRRGRRGRRGRCSTPKQK